MSLLRVVIDAAMHIVDTDKTVAGGEFRLGGVGCETYVAADS